MNYSLNTVRLPRVKIQKEDACANNCNTKQFFRRLPQNVQSSRLNGKENSDTEFPFLVEAHKEVVTLPELVFMSYILTQLATKHSAVYTPTKIMLLAQKYAF